jgi:hypothetical protein
MTTRRFPAPWTAEPIPGGFVVRDANEQAIAYVYARDTAADASHCEGAHHRRGPPHC